MCSATNSLSMPGNVILWVCGESGIRLTPDEAHALATQLREAAFAAYRPAPTHDAMDLEATG